MTKEPLKLTKYLHLPLSAGAGVRALLPGLAGNIELKEGGGGRLNPNDGEDKFNGGGGGKFNGGGGGKFNEGAEGKLSIIGGGGGRLKGGGGGRFNGGGVGKFKLFDGGGRFE
jgi:hypothetical protein